MLGRLFNGLAAILGAAGSAQFPEFFQQYLQRLGGRLDQTHDDLARLLADVQELGLTLEAYLQELMASGSTAAKQTAERELERIDQAERLEQAYYALREAAPWEKPLAFVENFDTQIAEDTLQAFAPAMPATTEGLVYAGVGMLIGLILLAGGEKSGKAVGRGVKRRLSRSAPDDGTRARPRFKVAADEEHDERVRAAPQVSAMDQPIEGPEPRKPTGRREPTLRFGGESHG